MNDLIAKLYDQAIVIKDGGDWTTGELDPVKFAELIVWECLSVGEDVANADGTGPWFEGYVSGVEEVNRRIKQHFGVE